MLNFCPDSGAAPRLKSLDGRKRSFCPSCCRVHDTQLKVAAGVFIERDGGLLLMRRTRAPFENLWNLPAGYAEADEASRETVGREIRGRTGHV
jgi:NADH pyrophosphatase NudC (nudix superfamily)